MPYEWVREIGDARQDKPNVVQVNHPGVLCQHASQEEGCPEPCTFTDQGARSLEDRRRASLPPFEGEVALTVQAIGMIVRNPCSCVGITWNRRSGGHRPTAALTMEGDFGSD